MIEIPRNLENDRNTSETYKKTKIPQKLIKVKKMPLKPI